MCDYHFWLGEARCVSHSIPSKELQHPQKSKNLYLLFLIRHGNYERFFEINKRKFENSVLIG